MDETEQEKVNAQPSATIKEDVKVSVETEKQPPQVLTLQTVIDAVNRNAERIETRFESHEASINTLFETVKQMQAGGGGGGSANPNNPAAGLMSNIKPEQIDKFLKYLFSDESGDKKKTADTEFDKLAKESYKRRMKTLEAKDIVMLEREKLKNKALFLELGLEE